MVFEERQLHREGGAQTEARRCDLQRAAVLLHDALGDEEPQAAALAGLQLVGVELHALGADLGELRLGQARAGVGDGDAHGAGARCVVRTGWQRKLRVRKAIIGPLN